MRINVGLESGYEGRTIAWALDYPGCFSSGNDDTEAVLRFPQAMIAYAQRIQQRSAAPWLDLVNFDIRVMESQKVYFLDDRYDVAADGMQVNAWFHRDWRPLSTAEIDQALQLMKWNREDLLTIVNGLDDEILDREHPGERWSIRGIIRHVGGIEWWLLDRLGLGGVDRKHLPPAPMDRLLFSRARMEEVLPALADQERITGKEGEFWSPRKVVRRALWHEMDHIEHIIKLLTA
jgi:hypothetical protein